MISLEIGQSIVLAKLPIGFDLFDRFVRCVLWTSARSMSSMKIVEFYEHRSMSSIGFKLGRWQQTDSINIGDIGGFGGYHVIA